MATHPRRGSCLLVSELAADPFGTLHRGVVHQGPVFGSHRLVRVFCGELAAAGLGDRMPQAGRAMATLAAGRAFPEGFTGEGGSTPHATWVHQGGRPLASLLDRARAESFPVEVDQAMAVVISVAQGLVQMHRRGLAHGLLNPHSAWITYEGAVVLADAPWAAMAADLLPACPGLCQSLAPYLAEPGADALQRDLAAFGALAFEVLTLAPLPAPPDRGAALDAAALPPDLRAFLARLVQPGDPFPTLQAFQEGLDHAAHSPGVDPSAFGLAFLMHALFREEVARDAAAEAAERVDSYLAYTPDGEALLRGAHRVPPPLPEVPAPPPAPPAPPPVPVPGRRLPVAAAWIAALVVVGLGGAYALRLRSERNLRQEVVQLEQLQAQMLREKAELDVRARQEAQRTAQLEKQLAETRSAEERARLRRQLEETQEQRQAVERQRKAADQRLAEQVPPVRQEAAARPPAAVPQPAPQAPPAAPAPASPAAPAPQLEPARIVTRSVPAYPSQALLRRDLGPDQVVRLKVQVGADGQPLRIAVVDGVPGGYGFDEAAVAAARSSTYSPALRDGKPVRGWTEDIVYRFQRRR